MNEVKQLFTKLKNLWHLWWVVKITVRRGNLDGMIEVRKWEDKVIVGKFSIQVDLTHHLMEA